MPQPRPRNETTRNFSVFKPCTTTTLAGLVQANIDGPFRAGRLYDATKALAHAERLRALTPVLPPGLLPALVAAPLPFVSIPHLASWPIPAACQYHGVRTARDSSGPSSPSRDQPVPPRCLPVVSARTLIAQAVWQWAMGIPFVQWHHAAHIFCYGCRRLE